MLWWALELAEKETIFTISTQCFDDFRRKVYSAESQNSILRIMMILFNLSQFEFELRNLNKIHESFALFLYLAENFVHQN